MHLMFTDGDLEGISRAGEPDRHWVTAQLAAEVLRLRRDCAEAYQVVGALTFYPSALYADEDRERALDNLFAAANGAPRPHDDLLPWPQRNEQIGEG